MNPPMILKMGDVGDVGDACFEINAYKNIPLVSPQTGKPPYRDNVESGVTCVTRVTSLLARMRARRMPELSPGVASGLFTMAVPAPMPPDASPLAALARFECDPRGVVHWLAAQPAGQERSQSVRRRFQECIRAEARARLAEVAE